MAHFPQNERKGRTHYSEKDSGPSLFAGKQERPFGCGTARSTASGSTDRESAPRPCPHGQVTGHDRETHPGFGRACSTAGEALFRTKPFGRIHRREPSRSTVPGPPLRRSARTIAAAPSRSAWTGAPSRSRSPAWCTPSIPNHFRKSPGYRLVRTATGEDRMRTRDRASAHGIAPDSRGARGGPRRNGLREDAGPLSGPQGSLRVLCAPGRTRTDTTTILSRLPLPIGLRGLAVGILADDTRHDQPTPGFLRTLRSCRWFQRAGNRHLEQTQ